LDTIQKEAEKYAAMTSKFTTRQILKMSGILLSAEFKSARVKSNKVSAWNLFQSEVKADVANHIRSPTVVDGLRPKFTGEYAKVVAERWPDHRDKYVEKANVINKTGKKLIKVPMALRQKRTIKKLKELVCHRGA
jgi:hypothetical protein